MERPLVRAPQPDDERAAHARAQEQIHTVEYRAAERAALRGWLLTQRYQVLVFPRSVAQAIRGASMRVHDTPVGHDVVP